MERRALRADSVMLVELAVALVLLLGVLVGRTGALVTLGLVVLVSAAFLVPVLDGHTPAQHLRIRGKFIRRNRAAERSRSRVGVAASDIGEPLDTLVPGLRITKARSVQGQEMGVVEHDGSWTVMLGFDNDDLVVQQGGPHLLDLALLARLSHHDDLVFAGVQVVTLTVPAPSAAVVAPDSRAVVSYDSLADQLPPAVRRSVLALRLDPRLCVDALMRRGSSAAGVASTLAVGLHSVQAQLRRQGLETHVLAADETRESLTLMSGAAPLPGLGGCVETWRDVTCGGITQVGREFSLPDLDQASQVLCALADSVTRAPALFAVTSLGLAPGGGCGGVRLACAGTQAAVAAGSWLDTVLAPRLATGVRMHGAAGRQAPVLLATVPLAGPWGWAG